MSAVAIRAGVRPRQTASIGRMLWKQFVAQSRLLVRQPAIGLVALLMPVMLYVLFALPNADKPFIDGVTVGVYMLASLGAYGVGLTMVFSFGVAVAIDRGERNDLLMRAGPLPPAIDLGSRIILAAVFSTVTMALLCAVALVTGVQLSAGTAATLIIVLVLGSLPLLALSFTIAYVMGPGAATATVNMLYMVLAFASGLLVPMIQLPAFVQQVAVYLPTYHLAQVGWHVIGVPAENLFASAAWLAGYAVAFLVVALWAYRRDATRRFH